MKTSIILGGAGLTVAWPQLAAAISQTRPVPPPTFKSQVAFVKTDDRATGVKKALELLNLNRVKGKKLFLKPNFNSADPAPGSTHSDTLSALVMALQTFGVDRLVVGDRSGMGNTRQVMEQKDVFRNNFV